MAEKVSTEGAKVWIFPDGDLPPPGDKEPLGHEALMILNTSGQDAHIEFDIYFEDKEPVLGIKDVVKAKRVRCFRLDKPLGDKEFKIPFGQYAMRVRSDVPVVAQFGRLDVRQPNMAYYINTGFFVQE